MSLVASRRSIAGSANGGIPITQGCWTSVEHNILPETELIDASQIDEAYERVLASGTDQTMTHFSSVRGGYDGAGD